MKIISYIPAAPDKPDSFWIACSKEEAEKWLVPLLDEEGLRQYNMVLRMNANRKEQDPLWEEKYNDMIKETMGVNEVAFVHFCISRDLSECYAEVAHHPFHQLWNGYSPFWRCDHVDINTPDDLKDIVMTLDGRPISELVEEERAREKEEEQASA